MDIRNRRGKSLLSQWRKLHIDALEKTEFHINTHNNDSKQIIMVDVLATFAFWDLQGLNKNAI